MSRTQRLIVALKFGYGYQFLVMAVGFWLTPILLDRLGTIDYGMWLIVGQALMYLGLLDLGVMVLLPRDVALVNSAEQREERIREIVSRAARLVWLQTPIVAIAAVGVWFAVGMSHPEVQGPLAIMLTTFVLGFPLRLSSAILSGLQDFRFLGRLQIVNWVVNTGLTVGLVIANCGLYALVTGWAVGQCLSSICCYARMRNVMPVSLIPYHNIRNFKGLGKQLIPSIWTSIRQLSVLFTTGTDVILIGWILGPELVVVYFCTGKLIGIAYQIPTMIVVSGNAALSEIRGSGDIDRLKRAAQSISLITLIVSGGLCLAIAGVNEAFIARWVGEGQYGGKTLTQIMVLTTIFRHWALTLFAIVAAFGYERKLALIALTDGVISIGVGTGLIYWLGPVGAAIGLLSGAVFVLIPFTIRMLSHEFNVTEAKILSWFVPFGGAFAILYTIVWVGLGICDSKSITDTSILTITVILIYIFVTIRLIHREPLRTYVAPLLKRFSRTGSLLSGAPRFRS